MADRCSKIDTTFISLNEPSDKIVLSGVRNWAYSISHADITRHGVVRCDTIFRALSKQDQITSS